MSSRPSKGVAALLSFFLGPLGVDKFYVGATTLGIIQLILTITIFGMFISGPWAMLSTLALVIAILAGGVPFLYPKVNWAPVTKSDKTIAWIVVGLAVLGFIGSFAMGLIGGKSGFKPGCETHKDLKAYETLKTKFINYDNFN
jgi:TM2 domain-containing membrane protein YozV